MGHDMDPKDVIIKYLEGRIGTLQVIIENIKSWVYQRIDEAIPDDILNGTTTTATTTITTKTRTTTLYNLKECRVILKRLPQHVTHQYLSQQQHMKSVDIDDRPINIFEQTSSSASESQVLFQNHNGDEYAAYEDYDYVRGGDGDQNYDGDQDQVYVGNFDGDQESNSKSKPFICYYTNCSKKFKMRETLLIHISQKHERKMKIEINCPYCEKIFYHRRALYWHVRAVHKIILPKNVEQIPEEKTDNSNDSDATVSSEQLNPQTEISDEINQIAGVKLEVDSNSSSNENPFACRYCSKVFKCHVSTKIHESKHERQQEYKCEYPDCEKIFYHSKNLYWHKRYSHPTFVQRKILKREKGYFTTDTDTETKNENQGGYFSVRKDTSTPVPTLFFKCKLGDCKKEYKYIQALRVHKAQVHDQKNQMLCSSCPRIFFHPRALNWHIRSVHKKRSPNSMTPEVESCICETCGRSFKKSNYLKTHIKNFHSQGEIKPKESKSKPKLKSAERNRFYEPKLCAICGRTFSIVSTYLSHLKMHKNERKYKCDICSKDFNFATNLKFHFAIHFPPTKKCKVCDKLFHTNVNLRVHTRSVHSTSTPFNCLVCSKKFKVKRQLVVHQKRLKH